jgi:hypothetical protein
MVKKKKANNKEFDFKAFLVSKLRSAFRKTPMASEALKAAKSEYFEPTKSGGQKRRVHYKCANCGRFFNDKEIVTVVDKKGNKTTKRASMIAIDHVDPVIDPTKGWVDWEVYVQRMFFGKLQILCNYPQNSRDGVPSCHHIKTQAERALLRETKKSLKDSDS